MISKDFVPLLSNIGIFSKDFVRLLSNIGILSIDFISLLSNIGIFSNDFISLLPYFQLFIFVASTVFAVLLFYSISSLQGLLAGFETWSTDFVFILPAG